MSDRGSRAAIAAAIAAIAALCWWLALAGPEAAPAPQPPPPPTQPPSEPAASPQPAPTAQEAPPTAQEPAAEAAEPGPAPGIVLPDTRGFTAALEERFATDAHEPGANAAAAALRQRIGAAELPPSLVRSIECRRTTCKLELRWTVANDPAYRKLTATLMGENAKLFATRAYPPPDRAGGIPVDAFWVRR